LQSVAGTDVVRVLHLTDPHLFADAAGALRGTVTLVTLQSVVADVQRRAWPADFVAVTGDIVQDDSRGAYRRLRAALSPLGLQVHVIPGNHDVRPLMQSELREPPFHYCDSFESGNWLVFGMDSCVDGEAGGQVSGAEMERFRQSVATASADHALVCIHHPPVSMNSRWLDDVGLRNAAEVRQSLAASGKVRVVLFGHAHQPFDKTIDGIRLLGTPSTCRQFLPGSEAFALDDAPPAYRRLTLHADGDIETELIPVDSPGDPE